ncbi:DnaJ domain-containing protein [Xylariaceae sp. FL0255]|nr:DnaJ domain-containing protein [Xylariaceae sp. FL0255]
MGAEQSSARGEAAAPAPKTDYYDLLRVDRAASDDDIKKAYRRRALELHPDRNFGDVENATQKFAEVQAAYDVLSDPQERAWYDSHRDAILSGHHPDDLEPSAASATTTEQIFALMGRFSKAVPLDDSPNSFFTVLRETFDRLAAAELVAAVDHTRLEYPTFGESRDGDAVAKAFYSRWANFSTGLSFSWKDKWRLSDAPDRRIRRLMEKENKKLRDDAIRDFNDAVRSLVIFARKRDPRYVPNTQSEAERQRILRDSAAAQAARSRAANLAKMNDDGDALPEWARSRDDDPYAAEFSESEDASEVEEIECVVCGKTFKSEQQYQAHEKSKKHQKAVQQLRWRMQREDADFHLTRDDADAPQDTQEMPPNDSDVPEAASPADGDTSLPETAPQHDTTEPPLPLSSKTSSHEEESEDEDYASRDAVEARFVSESIDEATANVAELSFSGEKPPEKIGKAKAKRVKKAAQQQAASQQSGHPCLVCRASFDSRSKLFEHLGEFPEHMAAKSVAPSKKSGQKKR